jgi:hypothetical protein
MRVLVIGDSLAFHGPERGELLTEPRLYPNVLAAALGAEVDVVARLGWTARDAWFALTRDPLVYSVLLPRADAVVLAVGSMDSVATLVPTYLREGLPLLRPEPVRRVARAAYLAAQPYAARISPLRALPQRLTDRYLSWCVHGIRYYHPGMPVVGVVPARHRAPAYGGRHRGHARAVAAALAWGAREGVPLVDLPSLIEPELSAGIGNPDGMHWSWPVHERVGKAIAAVVGAACNPS